MSKRQAAGILPAELWIDNAGRMPAAPSHFLDSAPFVPKNI
jgi:hypothetical protein